MAAVKAASSTTSQWDTKKHIAFSHVAHLGVDSVLFALRLRADSVDAAAATNTSIIMSPASGAGQGEDPAARGRKNRDRERAKREAKRKAATAAAAAIGRSGEDPAFAGLEESAADFVEDADAPCKNKPCVRRGPMEEKLLAKWEQVKTELATKVKGVQKLRRSVDESEKRRDAALEEITALKEAGEAEEAGVEERKKRLQAAESEGRRIAEESQRLEVELRKLRVRYQEETQLKLPMPHGSIISEADAWAAAAAAGAEAALSDGEEGQPPPPPFVSDGLTVSFSANGNNIRGADPRGQWRRSKERSKEHSGRFGRWGLEVREQWSCCLWDEAGARKDSGDDDAGYLGADFNPADGGGSTRRRIGRRRGSDAAGGCEAVPPRPGPGGMTTADDVHLVWGPSQRNSGFTGNGSVNTNTNGPTIRRGAWEAGGADGAGGVEERELWKPILASRISGCSGGAAWSLIRHRRRPQTANARLMGRGAPATTTAPSGGGSNGAPLTPSERGTTNGGGAGVGTAAAAAVRNSGDGFRRTPHGSSRPGSAPPTGTGQARHHNQQHPHNRVSRQSSLASLRSARARAGWQRTCPLPAAGGGERGATFQRNRPGSSGALRPKSAVGLSKSWSTYSVYSKGERGKKKKTAAAAAAAAAAATTTTGAPLRGEEAGI